MPCSRPSVTRTLIREFTQHSPRPLQPHPQLDLFTEREREIVALVAQGMSHKEIADDLVISPATLPVRPRVTPAYRIVVGDDGERERSRAHAEGGEPGREAL